MKLVELLVSIAVFIGISIAVYTGYVEVMKVIRSSRAHTVATALVREQFEIIRNMPYANIGIRNGVPAGTIDRFQTLTRNGFVFGATTTVRNTDDMFDGTIGGSPNDLSPADYKTVAIEIACTNCQHETPLTLTTVVSPRGLETSSSNGALFVKVFDANGQAVQGANVHIVNNFVVPNLSIDEITDINGMVQIVDAPPSNESYEITVSKQGYSTERTYLSGAPSNPNPLKPHATVVLQQVTQSSFSIDRVGRVYVSTLDSMCQPIADAEFSVTGSKLIGTSPSVLSFATTSYYTNASGIYNLLNLAWDTYFVTLSDVQYAVAGTIPRMPFTLSPDSSVQVNLITKPKNPGAVLVTVVDGTTEVPLSGATVRLDKAGFSSSQVTGQGAHIDTDWTTYSSTDGNISTDAPLGTLTLASSSGVYVQSGELESMTFDLGTTSSIYDISWLPASQSGSVGVDSVRIQLASNNDNTTWNFSGPDGTASTYYTVPGQSIASILNGARFLRYKIFLHTNDVSVTPVLSDISFTYSLPCSPPGQTYFEGLSGGTYTIFVTKPGYQDSTTEYTVSSSGYHAVTVTLNP